MLIFEFCNTLFESWNTEVLILEGLLILSSSKRLLLVSVLSIIDTHEVLKVHVYIVACFGTRVSKYTLLPYFLEDLNIRFVFYRES